MAGGGTVPVTGPRRLLQLVLASLVAVKLAVILLACGRRQGREVARLEVADTEVWDPEAGTFSLLNLRQVVLELVPAPCSASTRLLVLVSSGPANTAPRQAWRQRCSVYSIYIVYNIYNLQVGSWPAGLCTAGVPGGEAGQR